MLVVGVQLHICSAIQVKIKKQERVLYSLVSQATLQAPEVLDNIQPACSFLR